MGVLVVVCDGVVVVDVGVVFITIVVAAVAVVIVVIFVVVVVVDAVVVAFTLQKEASGKLVAIDLHLDRHRHARMVLGIGGSGHRGTTLTRMVTRS